MPNQYKAGKKPIQFYCTSEEKEQIKQAAAGAGLTVSDYIRQIILDHIFKK